MANDNPEFGRILPRQVSAHRAVVYAAGIPGWGEMYAGAWLQGALTLAAFLACLAWFARLGWDCVEALGAWDGGSLQLPYRQLGLAMAGMGLAWFWGVFNAARTARLARLRRGMQPQFSPAWAACISWLCPGGGHAYGGRNLFGALFLLLYLAGMALMLPVFREFGQAITDLLSVGSENLVYNPLVVVQQVQTMFFRLENSLPAVFLTVTKMLAIVAAVELLARQREAEENFVFEEKTHWYQSREARAAGLFVLGWFSPGAGQLLLGRSYGWYFLAGVAGCHLLVSVLLRHNLLDMNVAGALLWVPVLLRLAAMIEAPVRLLQRSARPAAAAQEGP